ncbi:hypothetical protein PIB30_070811 [Stylosanthes scabra]|uniref:Uncharacterized protein n=1 Tax=Stylosanthes scabra TaxID=79078 RepID=A0ABU6RNY7_9FABA|nr:hypothetical protein [Stylosanthes scabra]
MPWRSSCNVLLLRNLGGPPKLPQRHTGIIAKFVDCAWKGKVPLVLQSLGYHCHVVGNDVLRPHFFSPHDAMNEYGPCNCDFRFVPRWNK